MKFLDSSFLISRTCFSSTTLRYAAAFLTEPVFPLFTVEGQSVGVIAFRLTFPPCFDSTLLLWCFLVFFPRLQRQVIPFQAFSKRGPRPCCIPRLWRSFPLCLCNSGVFTRRTFFLYHGCFFINAVGGRSGRPTRWTLRVSPPFG